MQKRYNYRAYPGKRQRRDLARLFGCCRFVYNSVVATHTGMFEAGAPRMSRGLVQSFVVTDGRRKHSWLRAMPSIPLIQACNDANMAFANFFASVAGARKGLKVGYPAFKSRFSSRQSARFTRRGFRINGDRIYLAKIGWITFKRSRSLPSDPSSVTITHRSDGKYTLSFVVETDENAITPNSERHAGIDVGVTDFAAIAYSDGTREKIANPRFAKAQARRLKKAQQALSRKQGPNRKRGQKASNNYRKTQYRVAKIYADTRAARQDFARKLALRLARENTTIAIESLNIRGLSRLGGNNAQGRGLRRSINDAAFSSFFVALSEKAGDRLKRVNPAYTTMTCSVCGVLSEKKPLNIRAWTCGKCGSALDRDFNAAVNILVAAGHAETLNACGGNVRLRLAEAEPSEARTQRSDLAVAA